jgi:AraC-like DNA-binding protein
MAVPRLVCGRLTFRLWTNAMALITTADVPPADRFEFWRETIARSALQFRMQPAEHAPLGEIRFAAMGDLAIMHIDGAVATRYARTRVEIARSQGPYNFLHLQLQGGCLLQSGEQRSVLAVGDAFVVDPLREFDMTSVPDNSGKRALVVRFRKEALSARVGRPDLVPCAVLRRDRPIARLLSSYLINGLEVADGVTAEAATLFEEHAVELLAQALRESWAEQLEPSQAWREGLFVRACRLIKLRFGDPDLAPEALARELGVSTRLLQRIFAEREETVMKRVFAERIARAAELLCASDAAHRSVTDIAFVCGFSDSSHFGRVFATQMAATPTEWRRRGPSHSRLDTD